MILQQQQHYLWEMIIWINLTGWPDIAAMQKINVIKYLVSCQKWKEIVGSVLGIFVFGEHNY